MRVIFKFINILIASLLLISALGHTVLLASDNPTYRNLVYVQIAIQIVASISVFGIHRLNFKALIVFSFLSLAFFIINSVIINYGAFYIQLIVFVMFWLLYGGLLFKFKNGFVAKYA